MDQYLSSGDSTLTLFLLILACSHAVSVISSHLTNVSVMWHCVASFAASFLFVQVFYSPFSYFLVSCVASVLSLPMFHFPLVYFYFLAFYASSLLFL